MLKEIENIQNEDLRESRENQLIFLANRKQQEKMKERIHKYSEELLRCEIEAIKRRTEQHDKNKNIEISINTSQKNYVFYNLPRFGHLMSLHLRHHMSAMRNYDWIIPQNITFFRCSSGYNSFINI